MFGYEIFIAIYLLVAFATFLRGTFNRTIAVGRNTADPTEAQVAVHDALWKIRNTMDGLFSSAVDKDKVFRMFPTLQNLPDNAQNLVVEDAPTYPRIIGGALTWPLSVPIAATQRAANNRIAAERKDAKATRESYWLLAEHEDDPTLKAAYLSCDPDRILESVMAKAEKDTPLAIENTVTTDPLNLAGNYPGLRGYEEYVESVNGTHPIPSKKDYYKKK